MSPFLAVAPATNEIGASHQAEQRFVVRPVGVVDISFSTILAFDARPNTVAVDEGDASVESEPD